jgi:hypothetical protein
MPHGGVVQLVGEVEDQMMMKRESSTSRQATQVPQASGGHPRSGASRETPRMAASGAIAAVLLTVLGANALAIGFGGLISMAVKEAPRIEKFEMSVKWASNKGTNHNKIDSVFFSVPKSETYEDHLVLLASRQNLCFDDIKEHSGWPPDLAGRFKFGLKKYSISVSPKAVARYITVKDQFNFYVLVPEKEGAEKLEKYREFDLFTADADGVVKLAKKYPRLFEK